MVEMVAYLAKTHPQLLKQEQERAARWFLAQLFTTPGDILMVAGDHLYRTQDNDPNAYNKPEYLSKALSSSPNRSDDNGVTPLFDTGRVLLHNLAKMRERYPFVFSNTSIVDGNNHSSVDSGVIPSFSWYRADGQEMVSGDWDSSNPDDFFLGWQISARPSQHYSLHSRLYLADSSKERSIVLPDPGGNREWVELVNSCDPYKSNRRFANGEKYEFEGCGMVVLESVLRS
jgi:pullulanase/glycogen debranching enzyme